MTRNLPAIFDRTHFEPLMNVSVGLDDFFDRVFNDFMPAAQSVTFPPYNIRKIDENTKVIEIALAGYSKDDISISVTGGNVLKITGGKSTDADKEKDDFLYRGVAARKFTRTFQLAEDIEVAEAKFINGMLFIKCVKQPEKVIDIPIDTD